MSTSMQKLAKLMKYYLNEVHLGEGLKKTMLEYQRSQKEHLLIIDTTAEVSSIAEAFLRTTISQVFHEYLADSLLQVEFYRMPLGCTSLDAKVTST